MVRNKSREKEDSRISSYEKRVAQLRRRRILFVLIGVLVVGLVICVLFVSMQRRTYTTYDTVGSTEWRTTSASTVLAFGSDFLSYSTDGIHCTNARGKDLWSAAYVMQEPMVHVRGNYAAVADHNGRVIYIYDKSGPKGEIKTNSPIQRMDLSAVGTVIAVLDDGTTTPVILYNKEGVEIASFKTTMEKFGYPLSVAISDNSRLVCISYIRVETGSLVSSVAFYNFDEVGKNEANNLVSGTDYPEEMIPLVGFLDNASAYAVGNDRISMFQGDQRPTNIANVILQDEVRAVYHSPDYVGLVSYGRGDNYYDMRFFNKKGEQCGTTGINLEYTDLFINGDLVVAYNASQCEIYTIKGDCKYSGNFEDSVLLMIPTSSKSRYILVTDGAIKTIQLQ